MVREKLFSAPRGLLGQLQPKDSNRDLYEIPPFDRFNGLWELDVCCCWTACNAEFISALSMPVCSLMRCSMT